MTPQNASNQPFIASDVFVIRTPLLSFDDLLAWGRGLKAPTAQADRLDEALEYDSGVLRQRLKEIATLPEFREALFVASPDLESSAARWLVDPTRPGAARIERALTCYFLRSAGRATPFGLFAGCGLGTLGERTHLCVSPRAAYRKHIRIDMDYLCRLAEELSRVPTIRDSVRYRPNSSISRTKTHVRFLQRELDADARTIRYALIVVEVTPYLDAILRRASKGALLAQLTTTLTTAPLGLPTDDATALLAQAVEQQILVSELEPALTGGLPLDALIELLGNDHQRPHIYDQLVRVRSQLHRLNAAPLGSDRVDYLEIAKDLPPTHDTAARPPFHVDLYKPQTVSTLGRSVVSEIIRGAQILERISGRRANNAMRLFRDAFSRRYEGREVALTEALDPELGIGFDAPIGDDADAIIEDLPFLPERIPIAWSERDAFLMRRLHRVWEEREYELTLNANDVEALTAFAGGDRLPYAFSVSATIGASSQAALDRGEFCIRLDACTGPSGARFLGRFCHGDAKLANVVGQHLRAEEAGDPGACFAEIVHLPQSRFGNFLCRPVLREYEIPLLGRSGAATDKQLPIADLLVSVIDDRVALRSRKLGREVIPRLTTAHAYDLENLPTYRFLCALQDQGVNTGRWSWGALEGAPFLPRVVSGKVVLSRATWTFDAGECASLAKLHGGRLWMAVQEIRLKRRLPKWVALRHGDNELLVDFDNILTLEALSHELKDYSHAMIVEMLPDPQDLIATGEDGHFVHELILPFVRPAPKVPPKPYVRPSRNPPFEERAFAPGSEWIYAKVYAGTLSVDQLLCDVVHPLVRKATADGTIDKWFFVRYADPDWHVRLRFRSEKNCQGVFVSVLQRALDRHLKAGRAWRIQFDTYDREVESYGGSTASMQLAETIFHGDSEAVISLLKLLRQAESPVLRWHLAFCGVDLLLSDLGLDVAGKDRVTSRLMHRLRRQFQSNKNVDRQLSARFRVERPALEKLLGSTCAGRVGTLDSSPDRLGIDEPSISIFRARSHIVRSASRQLRSLEALGKLNRNVESLAMQFVHMHVNRLVRSSVAAHEFVLYDFLGRIYRSEQAKNRVSVTRT